MFAVIMAGGGGTRLWPKSRESYPKQMHALGSDKPLVQGMVERLQGIVGEEKVFIITNAHHALGMSEIMPFMGGNILIDPYRRDTAAAIGLSAVYLSRKDPDAVMGVFPADHFIGSAKKFGQVIHAAEKFAREGHVVTIGIKPSCPETGYGYIEFGDLQETIEDERVYKVRRFVEKPNRETAAEYLSAGNYLWNSGMFVWSIPTVLRLFEQYLPDTYARLMRISDAIGTQYEEEVTDREYQEMERISVDYGIMEKLSDILVIPGDFGWTDIGSWKAVAEISAKDEHGNVIKSPHVSIDTKNCLVMGAEDKFVATIGVEDLIVIDTDDALLVCHRERSQDVKRIVDAIKERNLEKLL